MKATLTNGIVIEGDRDEVLSSVQILQDATQKTARRAPKQAKQPVEKATRQLPKEAPKKKCRRNQKGTVFSSDLGEKIAERIKTSRKKLGAIYREFKVSDTWFNHYCHDKYGCHPKQLRNGGGAGRKVTGAPSNPPSLKARAPRKDGEQAIREINLDTTFPHFRTVAPACQTLLEGIVRNTIANAGNIRFDPEGRMLGFERADEWKDFQIEFLAFSKQISDYFGVKDCFEKVTLPGKGWSYISYKK